MRLLTSCASRRRGWDRHITKQIRDCVLFVAVISSHTDERSGGYFRREWRLAVERMRDMADDRPFLVPIVIDATREDSARVPDRFREFQWLRLPAGETPLDAVERIRRLLSPRRTDRSGARRRAHGPVTFHFRGRRGPNRIKPLLR